MPRLFGSEMSVGRGRAAFLTPSAAVSEPVDLTTGLVAQYNFNGDYNDSSGNARHLSRVSAHPTYPAGKVGLCAQLSGADYLKSEDTAFQTGDISFGGAGWIYLADKSAQYGLVGKYDTTVGEFEYRLLYDNIGDQFHFSVYDASGSLLMPIASTSFGALSIETWYFVAFWHDATANTLNIQVNNSTIDSVDATGSTPTAGNAAFTIGVSDLDNSDFFNGRIDALRIYSNRVLDADLRTALYNSGNGTED
jgi:hypothetical protein